MLFDLYLTAQSYGDETPKKLTQVKKQCSNIE
jgi:hypothetical protein